MGLNVTLTGGRIKIDGFHAVFTKDEELYSCSITHNLARMAEAVGVYGVLWHPEENGIRIAAEIIDDLRVAIHMLEYSPDKYKKYDSPNGWGVYEDFLRFIREYLDACVEYPYAKISVER